jgi:hypothetical protein
MRATKVVPDDVSGLGNMKKLYFGLMVLPIALAMMVSSCTKEDSNINNNGNGNSENTERKIEKFTSISYSDAGDYTIGEREVSSFVWDGNKLVKRIGGEGTGWCWSYNYEGDRLVEILQYSGNNNRIHYRTTFTYNNDKISEYDRYYSNVGFDSKDIDHCKYRLNYNDRGEITSVTGTNDNGTTLSYQLTWQNGNLTQYVYQYESTTNGWTQTTSFTYDDKIPWRSGLEVIAYGNGFTPAFLKMNNNPLSDVFHSVNNNGTESNSTTNYTYTYDGNYVQSYSPNQRSVIYIKYTNTSDLAPTTYKVTTLHDYYVGGNKVGTVRGAGTYAVGKTVKLLAIPDDGYHFVQWSNGSTSNPLVFTVTNDVEYQATFEAD